MCSVLYSGEFGIVYKGYIMKNGGEVMSDTVAIKTLKGIAKLDNVFSMTK